MERCLRHLPLLWFLIGLAPQTGCAGHSASTRDARNALDVRRPRQAIALFNKQLEVDSEKKAVGKVGGDKVLYLLDRASVLQQVEAYELSSRDLQIADKRIELLDFSASAVEDIGKYLFSDDVGGYRAPAYEKLMINTLNMVNYLARANLNGARIEARRFAIMQKFVKEHEGQGWALSGPGSYLAGFVFEKSGKPDEALRYYDEALQAQRYLSLAEPVRRLSARSGLRTPRIERLLSEARSEQAAEPVVVGQQNGADPAVSGKPEAREKAELLVVVSYGRVPAKIAKRIPIGLALTMVSGHISPHDHQQAAALARQGLVTWVNYPELGKTVGAWGSPKVSVDGRPLRLDEPFAVDDEARKAWDDGKTAIVVSAITRMIARAAVGEGTSQAAGGGVLGALLSLGTQAVMTGLDTPDTRSWSTLPARIALGRAWIPPGRHEVHLSVRGEKKIQRIDVKPGEWAVVNLTVLR